MKQITLHLIPTIILLAAAPASAEADRSLFMSPEYAATRMTSSELQLVDIRTAAEFEAVHIPGSIRIPLHFVKTKPYLKQKTIVLVNQGFRTRHLVEACTRLNTSGFNARILNGGITAWTQDNLPVKGNPFARKQLPRVSPREVRQELPADAFLPVDISGTPPENRFSNTVHLDPANPGFLRVLTRYNRNHAGAILIFNQNGTGYDTIAGRLLSAGIKNIFFLSGGLNAYETYLADRTSASAPRSRRMKSINKTECNTCSN